MGSGSQPTPVKQTKGTGGGTFTSLSSEAWATALLLSLQKAGYKAPVTANNIANIQRLIGVETSGNQAGFLRDNNPWNLNTYVSLHGSLPGGHIVNEWGVNVQVFNSVQDGLAAYVNQLKANTALLSALNTSAPASVFGGALSTSGWSGGSYANATAFPNITPFTGTSPLPIPVNPKGLWGQIGEPIVTGSVVGLKNNPIVPITNAVIKPLVGVNGLISDITDPTKLKNVGIFVAGFTLAGVGMLIFFSQTKTAKTVEGTAAKAA